MRIAIATDDGKTITLRASLAKHFYIYEGKELKEKLENPYTSLDRGRGRAVASLLISKNIDKFIAGAIGENIKDILIANGIKYEEKEGNIEEVLE